MLQDSRQQNKNGVVGNKPLYEGRWRRLIVSEISVFNSIIRLKHQNFPRETIRRSETGEREVRSHQLSLLLFLGTFVVCAIFWGSFASAQIPDKSNEEMGRSDLAGPPTDLDLPPTSTPNDSPFSQQVVIGVGASAFLNVPRNGVITVSDGRVLRVSDLGHHLRISGRKRGTAAVTTAKATWLVHVLGVEPFQLYKRLSVEIARMQGLELGIENGVIVIGGRLLRTRDWLRLKEFSQPKSRFIFKAEPDPSLYKELQGHFSQVLKDASLPFPDMQISPASVRLSNEKSDLAVRFERVLGPYGFSVEKNAGVLTLEPLVRVQILVTEIRRQFLRRIGVQWPGSYQARLLPHFSGPGNGSQPLNVQLNALEDSGEARILASPNLLSRSGKEAQFLAGGEFPIKVSNNRSREVIWKRYGVLLKIKPLADHSGRMSIALETEVSTIDPSHVVDGVPGLLTNRIESHFDLKESKTIALSGLIRHESGYSSSGLPGLSSIPILGSLFSSRDFRENKTELVVFVTPEVVNVDAEGS